jgi:hypothetical protein
VLFGGKLLALKKKSGGIRPIAIGYTWSRLAAKCANCYVMSHLQDKLLPFQLGVKPGGCEAVVHATRQFTSKMAVDDVIVKLDFTNAFNCERRDVMLQTVADELPCPYRFCHVAYGSGLKLRFGDQTIWSLEHAQQGDPLGPLLFCPTIQPLLRSLSSELIAYMDDLTLGGCVCAVAADVTTISSAGVKYGLLLNSSKCEAIIPCGFSAHSALDGFLHFTVDTATLLGAPLSTGQALTECLTARCNDLCRAVERLKLISAHDALVLLKNSLSAPNYSIHYGRLVAKVITS